MVIIAYHALCELHNFFMATTETFETFETFERTDEYNIREHNNNDIIDNTNKMIDYHEMINDDFHNFAHQISMIIKHNNIVDIIDKTYDTNIIKIYIYLS